jgi:hypothetical protein
MGEHLGALVDFVHALAIVGRVCGLPILFLARSERLRRAYALYAVAFIGLAWVSDWLLGACFLTRLSTALWRSGTPHDTGAPETWFTVRVAAAVFHLRPSEESVVKAWYALVLLSCVGLGAHALRARRARSPGSDEHPAPGDAGKE